MLQLEVGKKYRRRDGRGPVEIVEVDSYYKTYPFRTADHVGYREDGCFFDGIEGYPGDLVAEWVDKPAEALQAPKPEAPATVTVKQEFIQLTPEQLGITVAPLPNPAAPLSKPAETYQGIIIRALRHGGFVVYEAVGRHEYCDPLASFTTVAEAAAFITAHLCAEGK